MKKQTAIEFLIEEIECRGIITKELRIVFEQAKEMEKLKEDFTIGFAEWCDDNYFRMGNTSFWAESMDWDNDNKFTTKELLEIYKKTL